MPEPEPTELGVADFLQQCEQRMWLATTSGISKRKPGANAGGWLLAPGNGLASPSFELSPADGREVTGCGRGNWGVLVRPCLCWGVRLDQRRGPLNLSTGTIEIFRGTVERK